MRWFHNPVDGDTSGPIKARPLRSSRAKAAETRELQELLREHGFAPNSPIVWLAPHRPVARSQPWVELDARQLDPARLLGLGMAGGYALYVGDVPASAIIGARGERVGRRARGTAKRVDRPVIKAAPWPPYPTEADDDYCPVCDERYKNFRAGETYESVAASLPQAGLSKRAGYQRAHHGDVLRTLGVIKTSAWRERHGACTFPELEDEELSWAEHFDAHDPPPWTRYSPTWRWTRLGQIRQLGVGPLEWRGGARIERRALVRIDGAWGLIIRVTYPGGAIRQRAWRGNGGKAAVWEADLRIGGLGGQRYVAAREDTA